MERRLALDHVLKSKLEKYVAQIMENNLSLANAMRPLKFDPLSIYNLHCQWTRIFWICFCASQ